MTYPISCSACGANVNRGSGVLACLRCIPDGYIPNNRELFCSEACRERHMTTEHQG